MHERREYHKSTNYEHLKSLENDDNEEPDNIYIGNKRYLKALNLNNMNFFFFFFR